MLKMIYENEGVLKLRETTREIIQLVEYFSGIPAQVTEDPKLQTLAKVQMAREGGLPQHLIVYKSEIGEPPRLSNLFSISDGDIYYDKHD